MLTINELSFRRGQRCLLDVQSLAIAEKKHTALIGPNGAGKSTLLKLICREQEGYTGSICFHQQDIKSWSRITLAKHLAVLPQASSLVFPFTAFEVVALGATPLNIKRAEINTLVKRVMKLLDCEDLAQQGFMQLSGGQKQRVQLARVLVQLSQAELAPLLLLDEPTSAQDLKQQHLILTQVNQLVRSQGYGVISVLHDLNHALHYADNLCVMQLGRLINLGEDKSAMDDGFVEGVWGYRPRLIRDERVGTMFF